MVIDAGSCHVRAGFGGEEKCRISFPNMVGRPRFAPVSINKTGRFHFFFGGISLV